jgi:hypothetical protein
MNKREKIQFIRAISAGKIMEPISVQYIESDNGKDLLIVGNFTPEERRRIESGTFEKKEDLSKLSDGMLRRIAYEGYQPNVYFQNTGNNAGLINNN